MALPEFTAVSRTQGNNTAIKNGTVKPKTCTLKWIEVDPIIAAFRRQVRGSEFDITEMAITTYACAKAHNKPMTAIPVFLIRQFHHGAILINTKAGIKSPKDLEGKRVGVSRGYTVTTGVWARGILASQYGVDLSKVTWVLSGDEHVAEYKAPSNVVPIEKGKKMEDMLASGELVGAVGLDFEHPDVAPLIPNGQDVGIAALKANGHYPINHTVIIKDELIAKHPGLATDIFEAFAASKRLYLDQLKARKIEKPTAIDKLHQRVMDITGDPLPYGIEPNRRVLTELLDTAVAQQIIPKKVPIESLFAKETLGLKA